MEIRSSGNMLGRITSETLTSETPRTTKVPRIVEATFYIGVEGSVTEFCEKHRDAYIEILLRLHRDQEGYPILDGTLNIYSLESSLDNWFEKVRQNLGLLSSKFPNVTFQVAVTSYDRIVVYRLHGPDVSVVDSRLCKITATINGISYTIESCLQGVEGDISHLLVGRLTIRVQRLGSLLFESADGFVFRKTSDTILVGILRDTHSGFLNSDETRTFDPNVTPEEKKLGKVYHFRQDAPTQEELESLQTINIQVHSAHI